MQNKKYGEYGGQYVAESLMSVLAELETAYNEAINDPKFIEEYNYYLKEYVGRETPLYFAEKLSKKYGTKIYLKREDLNHTGAHKINNTIGQILLARRMGKKRIIAETGAGQHGCAAAFQRRDFRRNMVARRVLQAGIEIAGRFEVKELAHVLARGVFEGGGLDDGDLAGLAVFGRITGLNAQCFGAQLGIHEKSPHNVIFVYCNRSEGVCQRLTDRFALTQKNHRNSDRIAVE